MSTKPRASNQPEHEEIGTVRQLDQLGRIVVPAELRKTIGLHSGDLLDFRIAAGHIVIARVDPECVLCGSREELVHRFEKSICEQCIGEIRATSLAELGC
jgi:transcriptional pleiotropic regulator of transition state genes